MIEETPLAVREALTENVPILIGRIDADSLVLETEGSIPRASALGPITPGKTNFLDLLPEDSDEVRAALRGGTAKLIVQAKDENGLGHFEVSIIFDRRRGSGAYFLVHDVTETRQLQLALLHCTDREQMRIGEDLHDTLGQELTGIAYRLHALRELASPHLANGIDALQEKLSNCLQQSRDIAFKLSPHIEGSEILGAFERLCAHLSETFEIECTFEFRLERPVSDSGVAFNLFRIAQEACSNAIRHGAAHHIQIQLTTGAENRLEIADDGTGIDRTEVSGFPGMGIPMMKFRAEAIGGSLRVFPQQPKGTTVRCRFENNHSLEDEPSPGDAPCETCS